MCYCPDALSILRSQVPDTTVALLRLHCKEYKKRAVFYSPTPSAASEGLQRTILVFQSNLYNK
jgi:hypothetical protein